MFEKIKIAFFDVDGTLYSEQFGISKLTIQALKKLKENNIMVCIATGRPKEMFDMLNEDFKDVDFDYVITNNGQAIYQNNEIVYKNFLHPDDVKIIIKKADELDLAISLIGDDYSVLNKENELALKGFEYIGMEPPEIAPIPLNFNKPVSNLICYEALDHIRHFTTIIKHSVITHWNMDAFDFVPDNGVKVHGIHKVINHLGLGAENAIAFGDGQNDLDMLKYVGFGVAMGNASIDVQEAADYVCEHVNDDGLYKTLKKTNLI